MIIQMIYQMSGGRYDDRMWPPPGVDFEVPDEEGRGLVLCGAAREVARPPEPEPEPEPELEPEPEPTPEPAPEPALAELPQPAPGDPKQAWVDYAVSQGAPRAEAEDRTKAQLQAAFGGRL